MNSNVARVFSEVGEAFDPARYLGSSDAFIDRALERHREPR